MAASNTASITSGPREPEQHEATIKTGTNAPFNAAAENESSPSAADELAASETRRTFALQSPVVVRPAVTSATALRPAELPAADTTAQQMVQPLPLPIDTVPPPAPAPQAPPEQPKPALPTGIQAAKQPLPPAAEKSKSIGIYVPPRALKQIMPDRSLTGHGVVTEVTLIEVKVRVDTRGRVKDARVLNKVKANAILGAAAVAAAREWSFAPATLNGNKVESDHTIVFEFRPSGR